MLVEPIVVRGVLLALGIGSELQIFNRVGAEKALKLARPFKYALDDRIGSAEIGCATGSLIVKSRCAVVEHDVRSLKERLPVDASAMSSATRKYRNLLPKLQQILSLLC